MRVKSRDSNLSWLTLIASVLVLLSTLGFLQSFGIIYNVLIDEFKESKEKTAWVGSIPLSLMFILAPCANWLVNRCPLRRFAAVNAIPLGLSLLFASYATNIAQMIIAFSVPFGITAAMLQITTVKASQTYFDKRMVTAIGLLTGGSTLLQIVFSYTVIALLNSFSLAETLRFLGLILASLCIIASMFYFPTSYEHIQPNSIATSNRGMGFYLKLLKNKRFAIFIFANFISCFCYGVSSVHQVQLAHEYGVKRSLARQFPVFTAISNAMGRFSCGFIVDSKMFEFTNYYLFVLLLNGTIATIGSFSSNATQLIVFIWIFGFVDGISQVCTSSMVKEVLGIDAFSEGFSILVTIDSISIMLGPPLVGFIVDQTENYSTYFYVLAVPNFLSALIMTSLRFVKTDTKQKLELAEQICDEAEISDDVNEIVKTKQLDLLMVTPV